MARSTNVRKKGDPFRAIAFATCKLLTVAFGWEYTVYRWVTELASAGYRFSFPDYFSITFEFRKQFSNYCLRTMWITYKCELKFEIRSLILVRLISTNNQSRLLVSLKHQSDA